MSHLPCAKRVTVGFQTETLPAAGVTSKLWEIGDIVALIEAKEAETPMVRGPYKKNV